MASAARRCSGPASTACMVCNGTSSATLSPRHTFSDAIYLALVDRRPDRPLIDHPCENAIAGILRHHQADFLGAHGLKRHVALLAAEHAGIADLLAFGEQQPLLETVEAVIQKFPRCVRALIARFQTIDDHDQPHAVLHRRSDQAVAGFVGEAGLHAVGADIHGEQRVAILLADLVEGEFLLGVPFIEFRIGHDDMARQPGEFARRHALFRIRQSGRIGEIRLCQPELARAAVHQPREIFLVAGDAFGERDAAVIGGLNDRALQQVGDFDATVNRREHGRAAGRRPALAPGALADDELLVELDVAFLDLVEHRLLRSSAWRDWLVRPGRRHSSRTAPCRFRLRSGSRAVLRSESRHRPWSCRRQWSQALRTSA